MKHDPAIAANGWTYYDACRCGAMRYEYRNEGLPDLALFVFPWGKAFSVKYRGSSTKIPVTGIAKLDETLKKLQTDHDTD